jgi:ABC-2 type transport system ATP-binding protein
MMTEQAVISLGNVRKSYKGGFDLGPINLEVEPGRIVAVVGPNGAGKSTLFKILMNLIQPDSGNAALFGRAYPRDEVEIKRSIGYVPEREVGHDEMSATTMGEFISHWYPRWNHGLYQDLLVRYEVDPYRRFGELSRGAQRRLSFALALAKGTELLLLDEPTAGVDPFGRREILEDISRFVHLGAGVKTAVFATHVMEEARRIADHVVLLADGKCLGLHEKRALLEGWKTFWVGGEPGADVPGVVEVEVGRPTRIVTDSPEETAEALSSENVRIVREGSVDLEKILSYLMRRREERHIRSAHTGE